MAAIFISYRRDDAPDAAGRIYDRLQSQFGEKSVFFDIDDIPYGVDFLQHVETVIASCDVLLAVIGNSWMRIDEDGRNSLDDPGDFVRIEITSALDRGIPVIPVLVEQGSVPSKADLPNTMKNFAFRNAAEVRSGSPFKGQIDRLVAEIANVIEKESPASSVEPSAVEQQSSNPDSPTDRPTSDNPTDSEISPLEAPPATGTQGKQSSAAMLLTVAAFVATAVFCAIDFARSGSYFYFVMPVLAAWSATAYGAKTYKIISVAMSVSIAAVVGISILDFPVVLVLSIFLPALAVAWAVVELAARREPLRGAAGQPIVLSIVGFVLGLRFLAYLDWLGPQGLEVELIASTALPFLCLIVGFSGQKQAAILATVILVTLAGISEAIVFRGGEFFLEFGFASIEWSYQVGFVVELLVLTVFGWLLFARQRESMSGLHWLTSPAGLAGFTILGFLHTNVEVGDFYAEFPGSPILSLTAMFACGWLYPKTAQIIGIAIAIPFVLIEYRDWISDALAQEEDIGVIIVTGVSRRAGLTLLEVFTLPVMAYLGQSFQQAWAARRAPGAGSLSSG